MNIFRLAGDMTHLLSIIVLLLKIYATKSCSGISLKTQELYALVFFARYLDLFTNFISVYNTVMKVVFIASSLAIVWCMRMHPMVKRSYDKQLDTFRHYFLIGACIVLALIINVKYTIQEVADGLLVLFKYFLPRIAQGITFSYHIVAICSYFMVSILKYTGLWNSIELHSAFNIFWAFSIYLEAVAILPQLVMLQRSRNVDSLTGQYVFLLGAYRAFYILNWIFRYLTEPRFSQWIACVSGIVQTALYADFFYYYFISWKSNSKLKLPA